jgi:hypothetical protein
VHLAHALAAAARAGLEQDRVADLLDGERERRVVEAGAVGPGTTGTPAFATVCLARILSPIASIADGGGPTNTIPASSHAAAKAVFSLRNP